MIRKIGLIILALLMLMGGGNALATTSGQWATNHIVWLPPLGPTGEVNFLTGLQNVDTDLYNHGGSITTLQAQIAQFVLTAGQTYTLPSTSKTLMATDLSNAAPVGTTNYVYTSNGSGSAPTFQPSAVSAMTYPGAGVPLSTGIAWGTSYTVGTAASNLVQLNGSAQLPAVSGVNLTGMPITGLGTATISSAATTTITGLSPGVRYKLILNLKQNTTAGNLYLQFNGDTGNNYAWMVGAAATSGLGTGYGDHAVGFLYLNDIAGNPIYNGTYCQYELLFETVPGNNNIVTLTGNGGYVYTSSNGLFTINAFGQYSGAAALSSITIGTSAGTLSGTASLYSLN